MKKSIRLLCTVIVLAILCNASSLSVFAITPPVRAIEERTNYTQVSQEAIDLIMEGATYSDLLELYLGNGIITKEEMRELAKHDNVFLAQKGETLESPIITDMVLLTSSKEEYVTYNIPYDAMFAGVVTVVGVAAALADETGIAATLLVGAATMAYELWKANQEFNGITIEVKWVYYWDDNSLTYRNQPFVMDYYKY